ncbi:MAG: MFS transporter [Burkholderiales bacterium]|jgi:fucose permease|nr:MFS transporter [Burkholderiales bacterium]
MQRSRLLVLIVMLTFFAISFLTNILGPIMPEANASFHMSLGLAGFLPFAFFIAYGVGSLPTGYLTDRYGTKKITLLGMLFAVIACLIFTFIPSLIVYLISLFFMGLGLAMLQVVINPLLRTAGGEEHYSFYSVMAQMIFACGSFGSPYVYSYLVQNLSNAQNGVLKILAIAAPTNMPWISFYLVSSLLFAILLLIIILVKFPKIQLTNDEKVEGLSIILQLCKNKTVWVYFIGVFAYVGTEQGVALWISKFLNTYYQANPDTIGAHVSALFWAGQALGCVIGLLLIKLLDQKIILASFVIAGMIILSLALFGNYQIAIWAFPAFGFCTSVMYPGVFSLGLNSLSHNHGTFAGILCTAIIGGAVIPLLEGIIGNAIGLKFGMCLIYLTLAYQLAIAIFARPLVKNKTIFSSKRLISYDQ